jgi:hypothetical protein
MMSPGGGAGNKAASIQKIKVATSALLVASMSFETGSKEQQAILRAISSLNPLFGKAEGTDMVPAGIAAMARDASQGPPKAAPPPGAAPPPEPPASPGLPGMA